MRIRTGRRAVTLLEMLVALALMGVLAGSIYGSLYIGFRARQRADWALGPVRTVSLAMALVRRDFESALPPTGVLAGAFVGQDSAGSTSSGEADTVTFYTAVGGGTGGDVRQVELAVTESEDPDAGNVLVRRVTSNLLAPEVSEPEEEVLCRSLRSFNLRYFDGLQWLDAWDSGAMDNALPLAVEVTIEIDQPVGASPDQETYEQVRVFVLPCAQPSAVEGETTRIIR